MRIDREVPEQYRVWRREDGSPWRLGRGTAYKATDLRTGNVVVLRFFDAPVGGPQDVETLTRVGRGLARPGSPCLAVSHGLFVRAHTHLAVTEFVEGPSLAQTVEEHGTWTTDRVLALANDALGALAALHRIGVAHGDFGPSKLLFTSTDGLLKIVDGGLHPGATIGAPPAGNAATADDLRRLGSTLWFALTGKMPFAGGPAAPEDSPPDWEPLDTLPASASLRTLIALFTRTLIWDDPLRRPQNATALFAALATRGLRPGAAAECFSPEKTPADHFTRWAERARKAGPMPDGTVRLPPKKVSSAAWPFPAERTRNGRRIAGSVAVLALAAGLGTAWFVERRALEDGRPFQGRATAPEPAATVGKTSEVPFQNPEPVEAAFPPLSGGPPVSAAGIEARAARIQRVQPDTLATLKPARELRRVATLPVPPGRGFPNNTEVGRVKETLAGINPAAERDRRTELVLILGYSDQPAAEDGATESQEEADALASALFHEGVVAPVYACGLGGVGEVPEVDTEEAGNGAFVEVWVAVLLF